MIRYVSTRGGGTPQSFTDVMLAGMAPDGGLYVPQSWPEFDAAFIRNLAGLSYAEIALNVMAPFIGDSIAPDALRRIVAETYEGDVFDHRAVAPLLQLGPQAWLMELYRGPTLSFKDYALQLLGRLFDHVLSQQSRRMTIVGATSGDTGSAAIEACKSCRNIDIFILHPKGRTSDIQRRQMTSVSAPNVHNIAIEGTFDDCQALVKACFADEKLRTELNLSAVNSINWARIMAQVVYYFAAALALGAPDRAVSFTVPTGNFGNVYAAYVARRMGLPIHNLTIATNRNDIITRFFESGEMKVGGVEPSLSPSMDIQVSSNFERYLFDLLGRDGKAVKKLMDDFAVKKQFSVPLEMRIKARAEFTARRCNDEDTINMMRACYDATGLVIDPHTAVGLHAATQSMAADPSVPMVALACAHPAKFPAAVRDAIGIDPAMPPHLAAVMKKAEHLMVLPNNLDRLKTAVRQGVKG
jgi:threonine synthase